MNYLDNPIKADVYQIQNVATYYSNVGNMFDNCLNLTQYIWLDSNKSVAVDVLKAKFDSIKDKIIYAGSYYDEISVALRKYADIIAHYKAKTQNLVDEHNAKVKENEALFFISGGATLFAKTEAEIKLFEVVNCFENEAKQLANSLEERVRHYMQNAKMQDSFFENLIDIITDIFSFFKG